MQAPRETVDLQAYPGLVMILLGLKAHRPRALKAIYGIGKGFGKIRRNPPAGLLQHDQFLWGWNHVGIRQYWRDLESLTAFTCSEPHAEWWRSFSRDAQECGFWHETYAASGGIEAVYVGMPDRVGLGGFAPIRTPVGAFMSAGGRMKADREDRAKASA